MERSSCSFSCSAALLCSLETMGYCFSLSSFSSAFSFSSYELFCEALRLFKRRDELSNRYDLLFASFHMTASVSSQQNTIQSGAQLTNLPFWSFKYIYIYIYIIFIFPHLKKEVKNSIFLATLCRIWKQIIH